MRTGASTYATELSRKHRLGPQAARHFGRQRGLAPNDHGTSGGLVRRDGRIAHLPNCGAGELCGSFGRAVGALKKRFQIIAKDLRLERHAVLQTATLSQLIEMI